MNHWFYLGCLGSNNFLGVWFVCGGLGLLMGYIYLGLVSVLLLLWGVAYDWGLRL